MNEYEFATAQLSFAHRLRRLIQLPVRIKGGNFSVDDIVRVIAGQVDGTEAVAGLVVSRIARDDRRILDNMRAAGHVLTNVPSDLLYGTPFGSDLQRVRRYELIAAFWYVAASQSNFSTGSSGAGHNLHRVRSSFDAGTTNGSTSNSSASGLAGCSASMVRSPMSGSKGKSCVINSLEATKA